MSESRSEYIKTRTYRREGLSPFFECPQCGATATTNTFVDLIYEHTGAKVPYVLVECVGNHSRYPMPLDWFNEHIGE